MTVPPIDHGFRKDTRLPLGTGYSMRPGGIKPSTIVIHTTSSPHKNTVFSDEAIYLRDSAKVSAHFLVGKKGQIAQILHPDLEAWHAGGKQSNGTWTAQSAYANAHSIGIESHVSQGETWTDTQRAALIWLVRWLMGLYGIPAAQIETHRAIALPAGRKRDPEGWTDAAFAIWRDTLAPPQPGGTLTKRYRVKHRYITQRSEDNGPPIVRELVPGEVLEVDHWYSNGRVHLADGSGFADLVDLEALP